MATMTEKPPSPLKGTKKIPIEQACPWCDYKSMHPPGLALHIRGNHPEHWKGNLGSSLGIGPSRKWHKDEARPKDLARQREYQRQWYIRKRAAQGLPYKGQTTNGARYKRQPGLPPRTLEEKREGNRQYARKRAALLRAQGLNAKGQPFKRVQYGDLKHLSDEEKKKVYYQRAKARYAAMGLNAHGVPFKNGRLGRPKGKKNVGGRPPLPLSKECPICQKSFSTRANMTLHLRNVHGKSIMEFDDVTGRGKYQLAVRAAEEPAQTFVPEQPFDPTGDAAKAIMLAASVIRSVATGMKLNEKLGGQ